MNTNHYIQDYLFAQHQRERLHEAEQQRQAAQAASSHNGLRHIISRSGVLLIALGSWMERIESAKQEPSLVTTSGAPVSGRLR